MYTKVYIYIYFSLILQVYNMSNVRREMDQVITELESRGIDVNSHLDESKKIGLGDAIESVLKKFGITEERFKKWFKLKECGCSKRKKAYKLAKKK